MIAVRGMAGFLFLQLLAAQDDPGAVSTIRVDTRIVTLEVLAETTTGQPVPDLRAPDFILRDAGRNREIRIFEAGQTGPRVNPEPAHPAPSSFSNRRSGAVSGATIILLDCIDGHGEDLIRARQEAIRAIRKPGPGHRIAIYALTRNGLTVLRDFTGEYDDLARGLEAFRPNVLAARPVAVPGRSPAAPPPRRMANTRQK